MANHRVQLESSERFRVPVFTTRGLSVIVTGIVLIVSLVRAKREDIPKIVEMIVSSHLACSIGWILAVVILLGSVVFTKLLIRFNDREVKRLSDERDELQRRLLNR